MTTVSAVARILNVQYRLGVSRNSHVSVVLPCSHELLKFPAFLLRFRFRPGEPTFKISKLRAILRRTSERRSELTEGPCRRRVGIASEDFQSSAPLSLACRKQRDARPVVQAG